jgi:hypothetical protein
MATITGSCNDEVVMSEIQSILKTPPGNLNSDTIEQISKAVQNQLSAILPSMIQEMSKLTPRTEGAHMLAQTPRLAAGSTQGLRKRPSTSRLATGSTQGLRKRPSTSRIAAGSTQGSRKRPSTSRLAAGSTQDG